MSSRMIWAIGIVGLIVIVGIISSIPSWVRSEATSHATTLDEAAEDAAQSAASGQYGDMFGVANALFSGLAFLAVVVTLLFQQHDSREQQKQIQAQQQQIDEQNRAIRRQTFEASFFHLVGILHTAVTEIVIDNGDFKGQDALLKFEQEFIGPKVANRPGYIQWKRYENEIPQPKEHRHSIAAIDVMFRRFYEDRIGVALIHILRMIEELVWMAHESGIDENNEFKERLRLLKGLNSTLSDPMLHLLLYYGLSAYPRKGTRELFAQYEVLDPLTRKDERLIPPEISHYGQRLIDLCPEPFQIRLTTLLDFGANRSLCR